MATLKELKEAALARLEELKPKLLPKPERPQAKEPKPTPKPRPASPRRKALEMAKGKFQQAKTSMALAFERAIAAKQYSECKAALQAAEAARQKAIKAKQDMEKALEERKRFFRAMGLIFRGDRRRPGPTPKPVLKAVKVASADAAIVVAEAVLDKSGWPKGLAGSGVHRYPWKPSGNGFKKWH